jgi:hypothetical protein
MIDPKTVSEAFIKWMEDNSYGTFGLDIFLNQVPSNADDNVYWLVTAGGDVTSKLVTPQSIQSFITQINYRNTHNEEVEHKLFELSQKVNTRGCFSIEGFDIFSIEATMPEDNDRDAENRRQGLFTVTIEIYKSYVS